MKIIKIISFILILISIILCFLYIDYYFIDCKITDFISRNTVNFLNKYMGISSFLFIFSGLFSGLMLLVSKNIINKICFNSGYLLLILSFCSFFSFIKIGIISGGIIGEELNKFFLKNNNYFIFSLLLLFAFFTSFSLILFPFRKNIVNYILLFFSYFSKIKDKENNSINIDNRVDFNINRNFKTDRLKRLQKGDIPWISKVIYENSNNRIEIPLFSSNSVYKKFKLKSEDKNTEEYEEVDTFSDSNINKVYEEINKRKDQYYKRLKETWPDSWKNENQSKNNEITLIEDIEIVEDEDYCDKNKEILLLPEYNNSKIEEFIPIENENKQTSSYEDNNLEKDIDFDKIFSQNFNEKLNEYKENIENKFSNTVLPDFEILKSSEKINPSIFKAEEDESARILEATLKEFDIEAKVVEIIHGPVVTLFKLNPAHGVKLSRIESLSNNLALRLAAQSIRIIAPIPGEKFVGIEIPNRKRELVSFKDIINSDKFKNSNYNIPIGLGKDIYGRIIVIDLYKMPHILIAGATGAGKSVCVNSFISSILFSKTPDELKFILIDPKIVELKPYNNIPHLLTPVITDSSKAISALKYLTYEMERRYSLLDQMGVRDIVEYRIYQKTKKKHLENLPFIVAIVDEFADLISASGKEAEFLFARLAAKARAVGILLVLATQRPSADVITGLIKANIPARIAFQVISLQDSRIILDQKGAEKLLGQGDMLYLSPTQPFPIRIQGAFLSKEEVDLIAEHWKKIAEPEYIDIEEIIGEDEEEEDIDYFENGKDPLFDQALEIVYKMNKASASYLQRKLNIGYNRAARIVEEMEKMGIVGPQRGAKPREVICRKDI